MLLLLLLLLLLLSPKWIDWERLWKPVCAQSFERWIRVLVRVWERPWTVAAQKIFKNLRGQGFPYRVAKLFYSRECFYFLRINVFPNLHRHLNFVVVVLMVSSNVKAWTQWSIVRSKFTWFFQRWDCCERCVNKSNLLNSSYLLQHCMQQSLGWKRV